MNHDNNALDPELESTRDKLRASSEVRADSSFRQRLRSDFVSGALSEAKVLPATRRFNRQRLFLLLPAAAVAALVILTILSPQRPVWRHYDTRGHGSVHADSIELVAALDGVSRELLPGSRIRVSDSAVVDLLLDDTLLLELAEGGELTVPDSPKRGSSMHTRLMRGELRIRTLAGFPGLELVVTTEHARTELTGTVVSVFKNAELTCVCVFEGTARIGRDERSMQAVAAGFRKIVFADKRPSKITDIEPEHRKGLEEFLDATRDIHD